MSYTPPVIPAFSVGTPPALEAAQAAQEAPAKAAQLKTDEQTLKAQGEQAQLAGQQASDQLLQRIVAPAVSNPAIADSPQWQKMVQDRLASTGVQIPKTPEGKIDVQALQGIVSPVVKPNMDPQSLQTYLSLPKGPARDAFGSTFNPASITPQAAAAPMIPNQKVLDRFNQDLDQQWSLAEKGVSSPSQFLDFARQHEAMLPYLGMSFDSFNNSPTALAGLGQATIAQINRLQSLGLLDQKKAALAVENINKAHSVEALDAARTQLLGVQARDYSVREQKIFADIKTNQERADAYVADVNNKINTARNGSPVEWAKVQGQARADATRQLNQASSDVRLLRGLIEADKRNIPPVDPSVKDPGTGMSLLDQYEAAINRQTAIQNTLNTINSAQFNATSMQSALNQSGLGRSIVPGATPQFDQAKAQQSPTNPNIYRQPNPDGTFTYWDTSSGTPVQVTQ